MTNTVLHTTSVNDDYIRIVLTDNDEVLIERQSTDALGNEIWVLIMQPTNLRQYQARQALTEALVSRVNAFGGQNA